MSFKGTVAREVCRLLDATEATEILWTVGLFMTKDLAEPAYDVLKCRVGHRWVREKSFVRGGDCRGYVFVLDNPFFEFEIFEVLSEGK